MSVGEREDPSDNPRRIATKIRKKHPLFEPTKRSPLDRSFSAVSSWFHKVETDPGWTGLRLYLGEWFDSYLSDVLLGGVVLFNIVALTVETDAMAPTSLGDTSMQVPRWCQVANQLLTAMYCVELCLRLYVFRIEFFHSASNLFDMCVILVDVVSEFSFTSALDSIAILRLFRILRLCRAHHVLQMFPELSLMMQGMTGAMKSIFWGATLIFGVLVLWSIVAVQVLHPINLEIAADGEYEGCGRCPHAFGSTFASLLTFTQHIVTGDSWGNVSLPIIERRPEMLLFFMGVLFTVGMGIMNLILAVIVDRAIDAREANNEIQSSVKDKEYREACHDLLNICQDLDKNCDGILSHEEIMIGYRENKEFRAQLKILHIREEDLEGVIEMMDNDCSGDVHFGEFVEFIYQLKRDDTHTVQVFMKHALNEVLNTVRDHSGLLDGLCAQAGLLGPGAEPASGAKQIRQDVVAILDDDLAALHSMVARLESLPLLAVAEPLEASGSRAALSRGGLPADFGAATLAPPRQARLREPPPRGGADDLGMAVGAEAAGSKSDGLPRRYPGLGDASAWRSNRGAWQRTASSFPAAVPPSSAAG